MQGKRLERVNVLLKEELSVVITTQLKDSRLGFVTVTHAEVTPDLKSCRVYISVLGCEKEVQGTLAALKHAEGFLKQQIARHLNLRYTPKLYFKIDHSPEESVKIETIFRKIHAEEGEKSAG